MGKAANMYMYIIEGGQISQYFVIFISATLIRKAWHLDGRLVHREVARLDDGVQHPDHKVGREHSGHGGCAPLGDGATNRLQKPWSGSSRRQLRKQHYQLTVTTGTCNQHTNCNVLRANVT